MPEARISRGARELIPWVYAAGKDEIAKLAGEVFSASTAGDTAAEEIVNNAAN